MPNKRKECWRIYVESEKNSRATRKSEARMADGLSELLFPARLETTTLICVRQ